ncbi:hypothetical protein F5887DRAFT_1211715 [Amanita rubescens]|nr:hypothetical protein F5887DRAFT_1211715 [Amanita rubescens]
MSTGPSYEMLFPWSSTRKCTPETSNRIARYTVIETNTEIIKLRAESEREEAFKVLLASITEFKCGIGIGQECCQIETEKCAIQCTVGVVRTSFHSVTGVDQERLQTAERDQSNTSTASVSPQLLLTATSHPTLQMPPLPNGTSPKKAGQSATTIWHGGASFGEPDLWLAQLDWTLENRGGSPSRIVPLLLKLAYDNRDQGLELRRKVGKLHRSRSEDQSDRWSAPRKVLLASGEMTSDDSDIARNLPRVLEEARKDPESVIVQDPWFSQLDWSPKKKTKRKVQKAPSINGLPPGTIDLGTELHRVGVERQPFISFERTSVPSSVSETSKHGPSDILQPSRFEFAFREKANVGSPLGKTFVKYVVDGMLTSPGGEAKEALEWNAVCSYWMSSRDRIMNQMEGGGRKLCFEDKDKWGIILPQVITMGTVTRSAIEKAWLKASNAKKNRVGSGWSVHHPATQSPVPMSIRKSSSCMGDAQFANAGMSISEAQKLAENLYASTKGCNTHQSDMFDRKLGSESFVFNKLEQITNSEKPRTPALGCGMTYALSKENLPNELGLDYIRSRIDWVIQSSGVDYLDILQAVPYPGVIPHLGRRQVTRRAGTRVMLTILAYMLGTRYERFTKGIIFSSAVDVDECLREEVDMECVVPIGWCQFRPESLNIKGCVGKGERKFGGGTRN